MGDLFVVSITICLFTFYNRLGTYSHYIQMRLYILDYFKNPDASQKILARNDILQMYYIIMSWYFNYTIFKFKPILTYLLFKMANFISES